MDTTKPVPWTEVVTPGRFAGKTVVVTGAGSGIGRATALRIALEGGRVIGSDSNSSRLDELVREASGYDVQTVVGDVSNDVDVAEIIRMAGPAIDGLANIAGIADDFSPLHEVTDDVWDTVFRVNVTGTLRVSRAVIPIMLPAGKGAIVNIASEAAFRGSVAGVAYTASKHAVVGITRSAAVIYGPHGLRVNAVAPGTTRTNIVADFANAPELVKRRLQPLRLAIRPAAAAPDQIAAAITFLLSSDGVNLNGVILPSDGGWSAI